MEVIGTESGEAVLKLSRTEVQALSVFCGHTARGRYEVMDRRLAESLESELFSVLDQIDGAPG